MYLLLTAEDYASIGDTVELLVLGGLMLEISIEAGDMMFWIVG